MTYLNKELILDALSELANLDEQNRLWLSDGAEPSHEVSSPDEAIERLLTDSGLGRALDQGVGDISESMRGRLENLRKILLKMNVNRSPSDVIRDPNMLMIRNQSRSILRDIHSGWES